MTVATSLTTPILNGGNTTGTDQAGTNSVRQGGAGTGTGRGGAIIDQTAEGDNASGSSANPFNVRRYVSAKAVDLVESSATTICQIAVPQGDAVTVHLKAMTSAGDATDRQARADEVIFAAVNKSGTMTMTAGTPVTVAALSTGTLTTAWTIVQNGDAIQLKCNAASDLTQTFLRCRWQMEINTSDVATVTPQ